MPQPVAMLHQQIQQQIGIPRIILGPEGYSAESTACKVKPGPSQKMKNRHELLNHFRNSGKAKGPASLPGPPLICAADYFLWKSSLFAAMRAMSSFVYVRAACFMFFASADAATGLAVSARPAK